MTLGDFLTFATLALAVLVATPFVGRYIHRVMEGERVFLSPILRPVERLVYRIGGVDETAEQGWKGYTIAVLVMAVIAIVAAYVVFRLQDVLPLNQGGIPAMSPDLALQHVRELRDQHQLAELLGRDRRDLPDPGRGPGGPQLHLCRHRPGRSRSPSSAG